MTLIDDKIYNILCIKPRGIGDIILSTIILDNLKSYFPFAKIDYLVDEFAKESLELNPLVNKVLTMAKNELSIKVALRLRKEKYDLVFDLWSNPRSAQITFLSGARFRVGFAYRGRKYAYNILAPSSRGDHHSAEHNLELLNAAKIPVISRNISFYNDEKSNLWAKDFIRDKVPENKFIIGIVPSGGWSSKRCDASKWVEICKSILLIYEAKFLILWGPGDEKDAEFINSNIPEHCILAPQTDLFRLAGLINNCKLVIANDSGPMHISVALNIPTLGLFGPTNPLMHGPYSEKSDYVFKDDLFCIVCNLQKCRYNHECFLDLSLEKILTKIDNLIIFNNLDISKK